MAKMEYLNVSMNECDRNIIERNGYYKEYYTICMLKLQSMELAKFYDDVSVFDILVGSDSLVSQYARNENLVTALEKAAALDVKSLVYSNFFRIFGSFQV